MSVPWSVMQGREECRVVTWERAKLVLGVAVALLPGGLLLLLGWVLARSLARARSRALARGVNPGLWRTLAVDLREVVREARAGL
jgi:hypothetical protein